MSARYDKIKQSADIEDQKVTQTLGQIQRNNAKRHHLRNELIQCQEELRLAERNRDIAVKAGTQNVCTPVPLCRARLGLISAV